MEQIIDTLGNLNRQRYYAEWKKPVSKGHTLYDSICMYNTLEKTKL